ncbi:hypothetical protein I4U23_005595 [Adineta vaga]|nr:hypothetical protein I4U23_005595 [Adineta vaga]
MVEIRSHRIVISDITDMIFDKIHFKDKENLSCPCSNTIISYKKFISNEIKYHPICSSKFISQQWIDALYSTNASRYRARDFRAIAHSQFKLLSDFCSLIKDMVSQTEIEIDNYELITIDLLLKDQLQSKVNNTIESIKNSISIRLMLYIDYINTNTESNNFISSLNINTKILSKLEGNHYVAKKHAAIYYKFEKYEILACANVNVFLPSVFYSTENFPNLTVPNSNLVNYLSGNISIITGFITTCTSFGSFLSSTFDCLHNKECIELLIKYFPSITQTNFNLTNSILSSKQQNLSLYNHLKNLFIDHRSIKINYSEYFHQCKPSFCSYMRNDQKNIYYALTVLVSLYGGLTIILHFITPYLISMLFKFKYQSTNTNMTIIERLRKYGKLLQQLNFYQTSVDLTANGIKQQKIMTRVYIILLIGSFIILLLFHSLYTENITMTVSNPSFDTYNNLEISHKDTLKCSCSTMIISYEKFLQLYPVMHQVCFSDFVDKNYILFWKTYGKKFYSHDWRNRASLQFQLLSDLCQLANKTIKDAISRLLMEPFAISNVLIKADFDAQLNETLNQFFRSTMSSFRTLINTIRLFNQVDQPYMEWTSFTDLLPDANLIVNSWKNEINNKTSLKFTFNLIEIVNLDLQLVDCICATNPHCERSAYFYDPNLMLSIFFSDNLWYISSVFVERCSIIDSLLFSTLECFYFDSECFMILSRSLYGPNEFYNMSNFQPLLYNSTISRFPRDTLIKLLVEQLMIEQWNPFFSYEQFYQSCAPEYCTYSKRIRTKNAFQIILTLISIIGGLTVSLRIISPYLVKAIVYLWTIIRKKQPRSLIKNVSIVINLNIFSPRDFDGRIDRITAKNLGQWSTRLYIILFIIGLIILTFYTIIRPEPQTKMFDKVSFDRYNHLIEKYGNELKCYCSSISSRHNEFVILQPQIHQICSSPFASDEWRINITSSLVSDLSPYQRTDYRRYLSAHLQFLHGLCELSRELIENFVHQFHTSLFITTQLLSKIKFHQRLNSTIEQIKSKYSQTFAHLLLLIRKINHANGIISTYGTNYEYIIPWDELNMVYLPTQSITYDNCSCDLDLNCTSQANFFSKNSLETIQIIGLKIGCTPSESFLSSTIECFYNESCLNLIKKYLNTTESFIPLSTIVNHFPMNTTILELINNLFIEEWLTTTMNYSSYFECCKPSFCSYTYIQHFNTLYIITLILALQGGLTVLVLFSIYSTRHDKYQIVSIINTTTETTSSSITIESS